MTEADRLRLEEDIVECVGNNLEVLSKNCSKEDESLLWSTIASRCKIPIGKCKSMWKGIKEVHDLEHAQKKWHRTGSGTKPRHNDCRLWEELSFLREGQPIVQPVSSVPSATPFGLKLKMAAAPARTRKRTASETVKEKLPQVTEKISGVLDEPQSLEYALGISIRQKVDAIQDQGLKVKWRRKFPNLLDEMELEVGGLLL